MAWDFTVDSDIQLDMAKYLKEKADELDTQFANLYTQIGPSNLGAHWVGSDYDAFNVGCEGYKQALDDEHEDLEKTLTPENNKKIQQLVLNIRDSSFELLKIVDKKVDESFGISVKNVRNYENLYEKFKLLLEFEEITSKYEDAHFRDLKKEYPDILKEREKLAKYMEGVENCKKYFLRLIEIINQYKNNRLK